MKLKRLLMRLAREVPCLVSALILCAISGLLTQGLYGLDISVSPPVACLLCIALGAGWAMLEVWCIRRKWLRAEHLSFLNIESVILLSPLVPWFAAATFEVGIGMLAVWILMLAVLAVRIISWRVCKVEKRTLHQGWLVLGGIVSQLLVLLIIWGCSVLVWEESAWGVLLLFAGLLLGRVAVERRLVLSGVLGRGERTALMWFDGTNIVTALISAGQFLRSEPAYLPGMALAAGLCAAMVCAAVLARRTAVTVDNENKGEGA